MSLPLPDAKNISPWIVYVFALTIVTLFGFWYNEIENVRRANEQIANVQRKCDEDKIQAAKEQIEQLNALYLEMKSNHERNLDELRRLRKR